MDNWFNEPPIFFFLGVAVPGYLFLEILSTILRVLVGG